MKANPKSIQKEQKERATKRVCGAKLRGKNANCRSTVIMENGRCRLHGGLTPRGLASPHFKYGIFTKHMPEAIRDRAKEAETNPTLVELREQIALFKVRLGFLAPRLVGTPDNKTWLLLSMLLKELVAGFEAIEKKFADKCENYEDKQKLEEYSQKLETCHEVINSVLDSDSAWSEMQKVSEHIRRLVETEAKRMKDLDLYISADRANLLIMNLARANKAIIKEYDGQVCDTELMLQKIGEAFKRFQEVQNE